LRFAFAHAQYLLAEELLSEHPEWIPPANSDPAWNTPTAADHIIKTARMIKLDKRLEAVLASTDEPANAQETAEFATICYFKLLHGSAVSLFTKAFALDESLPAAGDDVSNAYQAACAAVLAADTLNRSTLQFHESDEGEAARLLDQAHQWLELDLDRLEQQLPMGDAATRRSVSDTFARYLHDPALSSVREPAKLQPLSEEPKSRWRSLWQRTQRLLNT
jgi:hypothetical protein